MERKYFNVPVLFIIFRRKDTALQVINAIGKVKPKKLYISQDGPRSGEEEQVLETRKAVISRINWDCELTTWFHKKNLGLKKHIPLAFDNFFKSEEYGIYLEDDTLPNNDFFYFQKEMLERYMNDDNIFYIKATNFYSDLIKCKYSYFPTQLGSVWGMGIWKRSWKLYNREITGLKEFTYKNYNDYIFDRKYISYLRVFLKAIKKGKLNTWDFQLNYALIKNKKYCIAPSVNLVRNIGINRNSTNVFLQNYEKDCEEIFPLRHPKSLKYSKKRDIIYFNNLVKYFNIRIILINIYLSLSPESKAIISNIFSFFNKVINKLSFE